jgi:hypothetical protein
MMYKNLSSLPTLSRPTILSNRTMDHVAPQTHRMFPKCSSTIIYHRGNPENKFALDFTITSLFSILTVVKLWASDLTVVVRHNEVLIICVCTT